MPTRSGREYLLTHSKTPLTTMDSRVLQDLVEQIVALRADHDEFKREIRALVQHPRTPEPSTPVTAYPELSLVSPPVGLSHPLRNQHPPDHQRDLDERLLRTVRVDAPTVAGQLEPSMYLDWRAAMDNHFIPLKIIIHGCSPIKIHAWL